MLAYAQLKVVLVYEELKRTDIGDSLYVVFEFVCQIIYCKVNCTTSTRLCDFFIIFNFSTVFFFGAPDHLITVYVYDVPTLSLLVINKVPCAGGETNIGISSSQLPVPKPVTLFRPVSLLFR